MNVDAVNRLDRLRTITGKAALLARVLLGGGSLAGTPDRPCTATMFVWSR